MSEELENAEGAIAIGKAMAAASLARREAARERRARALMRSQPGIATLADAAERSAGTLVAEGDSWFDFPLTDVLNELEDEHGYEVESLAKAGDTVESMAYSGGQLDKLTKRIQKVLRRREALKAILLSGGGNDVAGAEFAVLLNHSASSQRGLNDSVVSGIVDERARSAYITILTQVTEICMSVAGRAVPIVVHGYGYPIPNGRGFLGGWGPLPGPWLEPGFVQKGYGDMGERRQYCVQLIDRFNTMLSRLAGNGPFRHVRYVDLRTALGEDDWSDELHPDAAGFRMVANRFAQAIQLP